MSNTHAPQEYAQIANPTASDTLYAIEQCHPRFIPELAAKIVSPTEEARLALLKRCDTDWILQLVNNLAPLTSEEIDVVIRKIKPTEFANLVTLPGLTPAHRKIILERGPPEVIPTIVPETLTEWVLACQRCPMKSLPTMLSQCKLHRSVLGEIITRRYIKAMQEDRLIEILKNYPYLFSRAQLVWTYQNCVRSDVSTVFKMLKDPTEEETEIALNRVFPMRVPGVMAHARSTGQGNNKLYLLAASLCEGTFMRDLLKGAPSYLSQEVLELMIKRNDRDKAIELFTIIAHRDVPWDFPEMKTSLISLHDMTMELLTSQAGDIQEILSCAETYLQYEPQVREKHKKFISLLTTPPQFPGAVIGQLVKLLNTPDLTNPMVIHKGHVLLEDILKAIESLERFYKNYYRELLDHNCNLCLTKALWNIPIPPGLPRDYQD